ncbi:MAG: cytochrome b [Gammaproteobacteria bacterium]|nr:cytochrome b [Gammaproteobacteria bacterium]
MGWRNTGDRYGSMIVALHWLMLVLLVAVYASIELHEFFPKGSDPREALKTWHFMLGLSVLVMVALRVAARLGSGPVPRIEPAAPLLQQRIAGLLHIALYVLMIGMPVAGWLILSAKGDPIPFFGLELPPLLGKDKELAKAIKEIHEVGANAGYFLVGLHAAAGLYHHYFARDNTLTRILPRRA